MDEEEILKIVAEADTEVEQRKMNKLTEDEKILHQFAKTLLTLERDLNVPGHQTTQDRRVERLLKAISKENF